MTYQRAFKYSLIFHAFLLFLMVGSPTGCGGGGEKGNSKDKKEGLEDNKKQHIVEKPHVTNIDLVDPDEVGEGPKKPRYQDRDCGKYKWFGGVGLEETLTAAGSRMVDQVYDGYPAKRAGIQIGDILGNPGELMGTPGTHVKILYYRNKNFFSVDVIREKICITEDGS